MTPIFRKRLEHAPVKRVISIKGKLALEDDTKTAAQHDLVRFRPPAFGEYADLAERLQDVLRMTGYGELT